MIRRVPAVLAVAICLGASGCGGGGERKAASTPTPSPSPTPAAATPAPTPAPPKLDPVDWRSRTHEGQPVGLERSGNGFIGTETRAIAGLTSRGKDRWRVTGRSDDFSAFVADGVPIASPATGPNPTDGYQPHELRGLDPRTGKVRWTRPSTSYAFPAFGRIYAPTCTGAQAGALGECTLTAYDPHTGAIRWTAPTYANTEESEAGAGVLVVHTFPLGDAPRYLVIDPATGATRAAIDLDDDHTLSLIGKRLIDAGPYAKRPVRGRCTSDVVAYALDGTVAWRRSFRMVRSDRKECDSYDAFEVGGDVALSPYEGRPRLLDLGTGKTIWTGRKGVTVTAGTAGRLITEGGDRKTTRAVDPRTGEVAWTYRGIVGGWRTFRRYVVSNYGCMLSGDENASCTVVLDGRSGRVLTRLPGVPETFVPARQAAGRPSLMTRIDRPERYASRYAFTTLPRP